MNLKQLALTLESVLQRTQNLPLVAYVLKFILDIGATKHIISKKSYFSSLRRCNKKVFWGSAKSIEIKGYRDVYIILKDSNTRLFLSDCLFMPELGVNLVSPSRLKGLYHIVTPKKALLFGKKGWISISDQVNGLYYMPVDVLKPSAFHLSSL